jgi:hypothetical protein
MRFLCLAAGALAFGAGPAAAADPIPATPTIRSAKDLVRMNRCELENLYRSLGVGCPPSGRFRGRVIINPGSKITGPASQFTRVIWQGKIIADDAMVNRVFGMRAVHARVSLGESYLDGQPSVVMDYAGQSRLFGAFRDEIREVSPGLYLGMVHKRSPQGVELKAFFALEARKR